MLFKLVCNHGGRCEIVQGTDARSADAVANDTFEVEREDNFRYFGKLITKNGFTHGPGLSGQRFEPFYVGHPTGVEYAIMKSNMKEGEDDFWALWSEKK